MTDFIRVNPEQLAPAVAPFPQALVANDLIFISGQVAINRDNNVVAPGDVAAQTAYIIERMRIILAEADSRLEDVVSATVFVKRAGDFPAFNKVWAEAFGDSLPARATVVADLVVDAGLMIEIQALAVRSA